MKDNEFYSGHSEFYESKTEYRFSPDEYAHTAPIANPRKEFVAKKHRGRRKLLQFLCTAAMVVVVATAALSDFSGGGDLMGQILNAKTGTGIANVTLAFHKGTTETGMTIARARTDDEGNFSISLPDGEYTATASAKGYLQEGIHFTVDNSSGSELVGTLLPLASGKAYSIVLTWGEDPSDLDSHVESQMEQSNYLHVYFSQPSYSTADSLICDLDVDDTSSYGPETITLDPVGRQPYYYHVHKFSGSGELYSSNAIVRVYKGTKLVKTYNVPTEENFGNYWNVFAIKDGRIIEKNTITDSPDLNYAD